MSESLDCILRPRAIAVIGASRMSDTIGHQIFGNLLRYGFTGAAYPVNPNATSIQSVRAYRDVGSLPERPDLAIVVVPKDRVLGVVEGCGQAGIPGLVVISAGFREVGGVGVDRERQLVDIVRRYGMRMVGPNCMGVLNTDPAVSMNATFAPAMPPYGRAAFVSQSGALGVSVLDHAAEYGIGISQFVSVGNKPDVSGNDLLEQWELDPAVGVILMYVESFGNPRRFLELASRITRVKPIIAVKSGRSKVGARSLLSYRRIGRQRPRGRCAADTGRRVTRRVDRRVVRHDDGFHRAGSAALEPHRHRDQLGRPRHSGGGCAGNAWTRAGRAAAHDDREAEAAVSRRSLHP